MNETMEKDRGDAREIARTLGCGLAIFDIGLSVRVDQVADIIARIRASSAEEAACKERQRNTGERQYWELRNALKFRFQDQFEPALALMISNHDFARSHPCVLPCGEKTTPILTPESASDPASPRDVSEDVETISLALGSLALIPPEEELAIAAMHALDRIAGKSTKKPVDKYGETLNIYDLSQIDRIGGKEE
jgi:hypothetical protein